MQREERAKQFMPFSALKGYKEALEDQEKVVMEWKELSPEYAEEIDRKIKSVREGDLATIIYYCQNEYTSVTGIISKIDMQSHFIQIMDRKIKMGDLYDIKRN